MATGVLTKGKTFGEVVNTDSPNWWEQRDLRIVASDMTACRMRVLPTDLPLFNIDPKTYKVRHACFKIVSPLADPNLAKGGKFEPRFVSFPFFFFPYIQAELVRSKKDL